MADKKFLDKVYDVETVDQTRKLYDEWSDSYDEEVGSEGYITPDRLAQALRETINDTATPILDFGCGTGLSGQAFTRSGFTTIDGCDISPEMIAKAKAKGVYRKLWQAKSDGPLGFEPGDYSAIAAVGVISKGAAPAELMDTLLGALASGGLLAFSYNDHTFKDPRYVEKLEQHLESDASRLVYRQEGEHLPGIDLRSTVFILERL